MSYSHCIGTGPGQVQGTGPAQQETMDPSPFPSLGPEGIFLHSILVPIAPSSVPVQCE